MGVPKSIEKLLEKRLKLARELVSVNLELNEMLKIYKVDTNDPDLKAFVMGVDSFTRPQIANDYIENYIESVM